MNKNPELATRIGVDAKDSIAILRKLDAQYTGLVKSLKGQIGKVGALQSLEQVTDASDVGAGLRPAPTGRRNPTHGAIYNGQRPVNTNTAMRAKKSPTKAAKANPGAIEAKAKAARMSSTVFMES